MPTDAAIILPMTPASPFLEYVNEVALRTLRHSTDARILVLGNNSPSGFAPVRRMKATCDLLKIEFKFIEGKYSNSRFWNLGIDMTSGAGESKYTVVANADCIYYPNWLENLIELWEEVEAAEQASFATAMEDVLKANTGELPPPPRPYYALWPWSMSVNDMGLSYRATTLAKRRIVETHHPAIALVMKRASNYRWDESFALWEMDADFMHHCKAHNYRLGLCLNSRVDHFNSTVTSNIDSGLHFEDDMANKGGCTARLKAKWNLP